MKWRIILVVLLKRYHYSVVKIFFYFMTERVVKKLLTREVINTWQSQQDTKWNKFWYGWSEKYRSLDHFVIIIVVVIVVVSVGHCSYWCVSVYSMHSMTDSFHSAALHHHDNMASAWLYAIPDLNLLQWCTGNVFSIIGRVNLLGMRSATHVNSACHPLWVGASKRWVAMNSHTIFNVIP